MRKKQIVLFALLLSFFGCGKKIAVDQTSECYSLPDKIGNKEYDSEWLKMENAFKVDNDELEYYPETPDSSSKLDGRVNLKTESRECPTSLPIDFTCGVYIEDDPRIRNKSPRLDFIYSDANNQEKVVQRRKLPSFKEEDYYQNFIFFPEEKTRYFIDNRTFHIQLDFAKVYHDNPNSVGTFQLSVSFPDVPGYYESETRIGEFAQVIWEYKFNSDGSRIEFSKKYGTFVK